MVKLTNKEKQFIIDNQDLIKDNKWEDFYDDLYTTCEFSFEIGNISQFIYEDCDVNFLKCMDRVPEYCFSSAAIKSITLPNSIEKIDAYAFNNCTSLQSITIPDSVKRIGTYAFYNYISLQSIYVNHNSYAEKWCKENGFENGFEGKIEYLD